MSRASPTHHFHYPEINETNKYSYAERKYEQEFSLVESVALVRELIQIQTAAN
jgi:hypothetical protein